MAAALNAILATGVRPWEAVRAMILDGFPEDVVAKGIAGFDVDPNERLGCYQECLMGLRGPMREAVRAIVDAQRAPIARELIAKGDSVYPCLTSQYLDAAPQSVIDEINRDLGAAWDRLASAVKSAPPDAPHAAIDPIIRSSAFLTIITSYERRDRKGELWVVTCERLVRERLRDRGARLSPEQAWELRTEIRKLRKD